MYEDTFEFEKLISLVGLSENATISVPGRSITFLKSRVAETSQSTKKGRVRT